MSRPVGHVALNRALSKLGIMSRARATAAIREGRVRVDGRVATNPFRLVVPERASIILDGAPEAARPWRTVLLHKPRGVVTTLSDPEKRPTVFDVIVHAGGDVRGLVAVGRLDLATTGVLMLTTDTQLANRLTDPTSALTRVYVVTVRGRVTGAEAARLEAGVGRGSERMTAASVIVRKASARESHLTVELREGKNREVRRLFETIGHEVTRLKRVAFGGLELGNLAPGQWRELSRDDVARAFGGADSVTAREV
ncbi:MAG TPA: pseudouridine synthase [Vicinamibacterales bacterium]